MWWWRDPWGAGGCGQWGPEGQGVVRGFILAGLPWTAEKQGQWPEAEGVGGGSLHVLPEPEAPSRRHLTRFSVR